MMCRVQPSGIVAMTSARREPELSPSQTFGKEHSKRGQERK